MRLDRFLILIGFMAILAGGAFVAWNALNPTCCCDPSVAVDKCHCLCRWVPWF